MAYDTEKKFANEIKDYLKGNRSIPVCALNTGEEREFLGDGSTISKFKTQIKTRKRRLQREGGKTGHGRLRVMSGYAKLRDFEANFIKSYNHKISKQVIDFALKNNAGTIILEDLHNGVKKDNKILLRNWSYYQLQQMIIYKAKAEGIKIKKIPPHYTSQTCSKCGYTDKANRKNQKDFECLECGFKANADYNAAKNIAREGENCSPVSNEAVLTA